ncbi:MFS transporter [Streptomyces sp. NK08204]|uniref:MFS transporter n=1 Tax=Streptomyces sp. NK08204 TaxID=2873260 RepID=UPI001CED418B|nr:MFS transporter [Streptomyces sp. NK08204]
MPQRSWRRASGRLSALAAACAARMPAVLTVSLAVLAGTCPPPVGPLMRTLWGRLTADEAQRQCALSLDTAAESTVFALGPVLGGLLVAASSAAATLAVCAALAIIGFGLLATGLRRTPASVRVASAARPRSPLRAPGFTPLLLLVLAVAGALCLFEVAVLAAWGTLVAGVLTTLFSVGGVLGGLVYGRRRWRGALARRPVVLAACSTVCYALPALVCSAPAAGIALLLTGACTDVLLITAYQLVDRLVPHGSRTEAGAWINTAYNLGAAMGTAAGGVLVDRFGSPAAFAVTAGLLGVCTSIGAPLTRRRHATDAAGEAALSQPEPTATSPGRA